MLRAALNVFVRDGLARASIRSIAKECKASPALVLHHFGNLDNLFQAVLLKVVQVGRETSESYMKGLTHPQDLMKAYVNSMFDWIVLTPSYLTVILQFYHYAIFNDEFNKLNIGVVQAGRDRIGEILSLGRDHGVFAVDDIALTTKAIQDLLTGTFIRMASTRGLCNPHVEREELFKEVLILMKSRSM